ncbi:hypothetical protein PF008_g4803 [Phytophthora fragariae]|uniref:Uncharacterized protein n=1 Tax=Phytophthora fragariae TaxID=53985 RepID=A0A6G0SAV1_9STRA|nr:hypothetical protein PF008_g4803 [Phytophthora fragariae]
MRARTGGIMRAELWESTRQASLASAFRSASVSLPVLPNNHGREPRP